MTQETVAESPTKGTATSRTGNVVHVDFGKKETPHAGITPPAPETTPHTTSTVSPAPEATSHTTIKLHQFSEPHGAANDPAQPSRMGKTGEWLGEKAKSAGKWAGEAAKDAGKTAVEGAKSLAKSRVGAGRSVARFLGPVGKWYEVAVGTVEVGVDLAEGDKHSAARDGGKAAGGLAGFLAGAETGAIAGAFVPIPGATLVGALVGGFYGASKGSQLGEWIGSKFYKDESQYKTEPETKPAAAPTKGGHATETAVATTAAAAASSPKTTEQQAQAHEHYVQAQENLRKAVTATVKAGDHLTDKQKHDLEHAAQAFGEARRETLQAAGKQETVAQTREAVEKWSTTYAQQAGKALASTAAAGETPHDTPSPRSQKPQSELATGASTGGQYHVERGDSLSAIADKMRESLGDVAGNMDRKNFDLAVAAVIADKNKIGNMDRIKEGADIALPTAQEVRAGVEKLQKSGVINQEGAVDYVALRNASGGGLVTPSSTPTTLASAQDAGRPKAAHSV